MAVAFLPPTLRDECVSCSKSMKFTDEDTYRYYLGDFIIGRLYNSPIPDRKDDTPSFHVYEDDNNNLLWNDFGLADQFGNKPANLVQYLKGYPLTTMGWKRARDQIWMEVGSHMIGRPPYKLKRTKRIKIADAAFVKSRNTWEPYELAYWERFGLEPEDLPETWPLSCLKYKDNPTCYASSNPTDPAYVYWWSKNPASWKIYRPLTENKRDKFRQTNVSDIIEGWNTVKDLPDSSFDTMIIASSSKDRFVLKKAFPEWGVINPTGETSYEPIVNAADKIKSLAKRVFITFDADDPGFKGSKKLSSMTGFPFIDMRDRLRGWKDPSDFIDTERGGFSYDDLRNVYLELILFGINYEI